MFDIKGLELGCMGMRLSDRKRSIGTVRVAHPNESVDALNTELTAGYIRRIEAAFPAEKVRGIGMRTLTFRNGQFAR